MSEPDLCPACISINRNYYYLHQHGNTICSSSIRKYYYLHQYQEILLLTSAWKYLRQQQEEELLLQASPYSRNYYYLLQHREYVVLSSFLKRLVDGKPNFSFPLVFQVTLLILLLLMHLSPPTYIHISPIHILHIHIYHIVLLVCIIAAWLNWILACLQCGSCLDQRPAPAPVLDLTGLD